MKFSPVFQKGTFLRRYKRFLTDIETSQGDTITIHCPNTGSMKACLVPGSPCWYSQSDNPKRKYPQTWEIATTEQGFMAGINTGRANALVEEAITAGIIRELGGYDTLRREVKYGEEGSRIDFLLSKTGAAACYVEVKSVTLEGDNGLGLFPDAVSSRGAKHLRELAGVVAAGARGVLVYCVQHSGVERVAVAEEIDPGYADALREAVDKGVEVIAYGAVISPSEIALSRQLPVILP